MRKFLILLLLPAAMLYSSCTTGLSKIRDDFGVVVAKTKAAVEKGEAFAKAADEKIVALNAKMDAAAEKFRSAGAPVDGSASELISWGSKNPGLLSSLGLGSYLLLILRSWLKYKNVATALVDAGETLREKHPDAAETYRAAAASSSRMGAAETALIATLKAR